MNNEPKPTPNLLWSIFSMKCPRCRRGNLFIHKNPFAKLNLKYILDMHETCPVCKQRFEMETGFWYGTGYMSYAITVAISVFTFLLWWVTIGFSFDDNRIFYWIVTNAAILIASQPWLMRISRVLYIYLFIKYSPNYENEKSVTFN